MNPSIDIQPIVNRYPHASCVTFDDSLLVTSHTRPMAWIHTGTCGNPSYPYIDVAMVRTCSTVTELYSVGRAMESRIFVRQQEALDFIDGLLGQEVRS